VAQADRHLRLAGVPGAAFTEQRQDVAAPRALLTVVVGPDLTPANDPETRRLVAQIAANESWANTADRSARTARARAALQAKFERQVDPEGTLPPAERA